MIKCKLIYKNGIRQSIDFLENENKIHHNIKHGLLVYCRYSIHQYETIEFVELTCLVTVDYSLFGNNSDIKLNQIIYSQQTTIPTIIQIIPISSSDQTDCFPHLKYNQSFSSTSEVIGLKNMDGILISIKNELENKFETIKITNIYLEPTIFNNYIPLVFIGDDHLELSTEQFIKFKLNIGDELIVNLETGEVLPAQQKDNFTINYKCECGENIKIESNKLVCSNKYNMCCFDYNVIIDNYLNICNEDDLYSIYSNYDQEDLKEFVEYLISISEINFYSLTDQQKCVIFNLNDSIIFDSTFNIDQCIKSLTYSQGIPMKHKKEYINILKGLYNDE